MINKYETKPCTIRAIQWDGDNIQEIIEFGNGDVQYIIHGGRIIPIIETLEGTMQASLFDYIIEGLRGEFYPCKEDVFNRKYKIIEEEEE